MRHAPNPRSCLVKQPQPAVRNDSRDQPYIFLSVAGADVFFQPAVELAVVQGEGDVVCGGSGDGGGVGEFQGCGAGLGFTRTMPWVWGCGEGKLDGAEADAVDDGRVRGDLGVELGGHFCFCLGDELGVCDVGECSPVLESLCMSGGGGVVNIGSLGGCD